MHDNRTSLPCWPYGESELARLVQAHDWSATALGPVERWPSLLRTTLTMILDNPLPMVLAWGPDLITLYNDAYRPLLGDKPEALGRSFLEVWDEAGHIIAPQLARALAGEATRVESALFKLLRSDRPQDAYFDYSFSPVRDEAGAVAGVLNVAMETTRRVLAERAQHEAETALRGTSAQFRLILENAKDHVIFTTDADGQIDTWPPGAEAVLGWTPDEAIGQSADLMFVPKDRATGAPEKELALAREAGVAPDVRWHQRRDGGRAFIDGTVRPLLDASGGLSGYLKVGQDITERRAIEQALRESEGRFRQFADASTSIVWMRDAATLRMDFASPAFAVIYGRTCDAESDDNSLRCWARMIVPEDRKRVFENFRRVRAGERVQQEYRIRRASDGALRWIHNTDFPMFDAEGRVRYVAGLGADVTDAKRAVERQGVLVAELQHRTRNLIGVVRSLADRTADNASSLEDFGERFGRRLSALSRVQGLLSHLTAGQRVTFDELLRAELTAHGALDGKAKRVTLDGSGDVPLRSDTVQTFALALHELATNAIKYGALATSNPDGHLTIRWHVEPAAEGERPNLHVSWHESGVVMPHVNAPARGGGYGRELIERALPYQLGAKTSYELGADGVRCTITVPIARGGE
ncbi:PAS domain S-box protein [Sphingomonas panaciterrae]|uniref:PAS domain-containing sensor histidine kinase n=1 Tax=Sphingomonas panaciterrae TaxID=1462999 RepID=UPI002FEF5460